MCGLTFSLCKADSQQVSILEYEDVFSFSTFQVRDPVYIVVWAFDERLL